jgi:hypothetical protein
MPGLTPTRTEISDRFPVLGFRVRTGRNPYYEVAVATDPSLFHPEAKAQRNSSNFYSSRSGGPLQAEHGETVFFVQPHILRHFAGQERLYFTIAAFPDTSRANPEILNLPDDVRPWVTISKSFTGRETRRLIGTPSRNASGNGRSGYGSVSPDAFTWTGDDVAPGTTQRVEPVGNGVSSSSKDQASKQSAPKSNGTAAASDAAAGGKASAAAAAASSYVDKQLEVDYDDGYDPRLWSQGQGIPAMAAKPAVAKSAADASSTTLLQPWTDIAWDGVELIGERDDAPSWIAAAAMLAGWRDHASVDPGPIANKLGMGADRATIAKACNLDLVSGAAYSLAELHDQLANFGPLWAAGVSPSDSHAFIITCVCGDGTEDGTRVGIMDTRGQVSGSPKAAQQSGTAGQGSSYTVSFRELAAQYDPRMIPNPADATHVAFQFMRSKTTAGHRPLAACNPVLSVASSYKHSTALDTAQSFDEDWADVELLAQPTNASCWATAAAMVYGWQNRVSIAPDSIASLVGQSINVGAAPKDRKILAEKLGLAWEPPQCYSVDGFRQMLENYGPLWVGIVTEDGWNHGVVATGMYGDGTPTGTFVRVNDPWGRAPGTPAKPGSHNPTPGQGSRYVLPFDEFMKEYEERITSNGNVVNIQIAHATDTGGRTISASAPAQSQSYAYSLSSAQRHKKAKQKLVGKTLQAQVVVPIATTIAGAVLTRVLNNEGDIKWELDQLKGLKNPHDDAANAGGGAFSDSKIKITGPVIENYLTDQIYANFEVLWQYNGRSLGNITISNTQTNDAVGWGLEVKANINDDAKVYPVSGGSGECAGLHTRFYFRFTRTVGSDQIYILDLWLHGDGTFTSSGSWTQD